MSKWEKLLTRIRTLSNILFDVFFYIGMDHTILLSFL